MGECDEVTYRCRCFGDGQVEPTRPGLWLHGMSSEMTRRKKRTSALCCTTLKLIGGTIHDCIVTAADGVACERGHDVELAV